MTTLYGIKNCDTVKKARKWLEQNNIDYQFHDFRVDGLTSQQVKQWCEKTDWQTLLNTRSTTWRQLADVEKENIDQQKAIKLMETNPTLIKRPVLNYNEAVHVGFKADHYQQIF